MKQELSDTYEPSVINSPDRVIASCSDPTLYAIGCRALALLEDAGFPSYFVGGFVRDAFLKREQHDIDLTTAALPQETMELFSQAGFTVHATGISHGTVTVIIDDKPLEITTFRGEGAYSDHRHPDEVLFVKTIEEDLSRRDFTINAMAFSPTRGFKDPYGGLWDLANKTVRAVGVPQLRFREDALRILRACRFASELGFTLSADTCQAIKETAHWTSTLPAERVFPEFTRLLCGQAPFDVLMDCHEVVFTIIPELRPAWMFDQKTPYHIYDVYEHTAHVVEHMSPATPLNRWLGLLHDAGKPVSFAPDEAGIGHFPNHPEESALLAEQVADRLKMPNDLRRDLLLLVLHHDDYFDPDRISVCRMMHILNGRFDLYEDLMSMKRADTLSQAPHCRRRLDWIADLEAEGKAAVAEGEAFTVRDLNLTGDDLTACGLNPGPRFKVILEYALDGVIEKAVPNEKEALIAYLKKHDMLA